jgi:putative endonuclease
LLSGFKVKLRYEGEEVTILLISVAKIFIHLSYHYNMKSLIVYILLCTDDSYYVGVTNNIERRLLEHETVYNPESYTAQRLPVKLVYQELVHGPLTAHKRERQIKGWTRAKKEALIIGNLEVLKRKSKKQFYAGGVILAIRRLTE